MTMLTRIGEKHLERWLSGYLIDRLRLFHNRNVVQAPAHLLFAFCDHYEPLWAAGGKKAELAIGLERVSRWRREYPILAERFRDSDGRVPRHSFFFPAEEYHPELFEHLDDLARRGYGEVELHLHHGDDTAESLRAQLQDAVETYRRHGHLSRDAQGRARYAFIHGNWALANGRPDGRHCGVDQELEVLFETGCFADFTFPSCPDVTQPRRVNQIYWPLGKFRERRGYEHGRRARVGDDWHDRQLMITGPLGFACRSGTLRPRLEYGAVTAHDPADISRVRSWLRARIHIEGRAEWTFVKVYTHGASESQAGSLLGAGGLALHGALAQVCEEARLKLHYVTAREMYNVARAAMAGQVGDPGKYRDYELPPPPIAVGQELLDQSR